MEWQQLPDGSWKGRVSYMSLLRADRWARYDEWLPQRFIEPAP